MAGNWGGTLPTLSDSANIVNGGTATIILPGAQCNSLCLGSSNSSGTIQMPGGSLSNAAAEYVGYQGTGMFIQTGGTNTVGGSGLYLGFGSGSHGTYNLSGSGLSPPDGLRNRGLSGHRAFRPIRWDQRRGQSLPQQQQHLYPQQLRSTSAYNEYLGWFSGAGTIIQSGGTNTVSGQIDVGYYAGGVATYSQSGGFNMVSGQLYLGSAASSSGTYNLSGAGSLSAVTEYVGSASPGTFSQSGGTNSTGFLYLGQNAGISGSYLLSGSGVLSTNFEYLGSSGTGARHRLADADRRNQ